MNTIFAKLLYEMEKQHDTVMVTIIADRGSAPRGLGSQMLVGRQGQLLGTIGGGAVEKRSEELALELLAENHFPNGRLHEFQLRRNETEDIGMVCGGDVTVLLQAISGTDAVWNAVAGKLMDQTAEKRPGWLVQRTDGGTPTLLDENGTVLAGAELSDAGALMAPGGVLRDGYFSMPLPIGERVILFGGGHCALALAPLLYNVGFRVTVMDCRPEFANTERFPWTEQVVCGDYLHIKDYLTLTAEDYVVVMTNGHSHDFEVQEQVLRGPLAYIGVIGSKSKTAAVNKRLRENGISEEAIQSVHTPIGTAIKAVTPEEIAVSIAGELIYERALRRESAGDITHGCPVH